MVKKKTAALMLLSLTTVMALVSCGRNGGKEYTYTYNTYLSTSPTNWNVHNWETSDESYITGFTEMGLYDCILNEEKNGYSFVTEMAAEMPIPVDSKTLTDEEIDTYYPRTGNPPSGVVWDIKLNKDAKWEDGTPITAKDYVDSMERQLSPKLVNYRADSYYDGTLSIANAETYYKQGRQTIEPAYNYLNSATGEVPDDTGIWYVTLGKYTPYVASVFSGTDNDTTLYAVLNQRSTKSSDAVELAAQRVTNAIGYYLWKFVDHSESSDKDDWEKLKSPTGVSSTMFTSMDYIDMLEFDENEVYTNEVLNETTYEEDEYGLPVSGWEVYSSKDLQNDLQTVVSGLGRGGSTSKSWSWKYACFTLITTVAEEDEVTFDEVGIKAVGDDDYTIRLYLSKSITSLNLKFSLSGNWLVNVPLYDKLTIDLATGSKATKYATDAVSNYKSYGPYKLTGFEAGKEITIEKNDEWYGWTDGKHEGQFQMEKIHTQIIKDHNTAMAEFEKGNLDDIDLNVNDMRKYGTSGRRSTTYESYTQKISFNSSWNKLRSRQSGNDNKTVMNNKLFRKGLSLATDRNAFAAAATSGSKGFTGLLNDLYLANNNTGESYRNTEQGKSVYNMIYGNLGGDQGQIVSIMGPNGAETDVIGTGELSEKACGYNLALAELAVTEGLREELTSTKDGHLQPGNTINMQFRVYDDTSENTIAAYNFINTAWTAVIDAANSALVSQGVIDEAGKLTLKIEMLKDEDYYTSAHNGNYDIIFSTWGGAAINPAGLMEVYCDKTFTNCCEYGFMGQQDNVLLDIDADGDGSIANDGSETKSFHAWYDSLEGEGSKLNEGIYGDDVKPGDENYEAWSTVHETRLNILAGLEAGVVNRYEAVPLVARGSSSLLGFKVENATDTYVSLVGYGGIRFLKFNYTNAEWKQFCAENNNNLAELYQTYVG